MRECTNCGARYHGTPELCPLDGAVLREFPDENLGREIGGWILRHPISESPLATVFHAMRDELSGALKLYKASAPLRRTRREIGAQERIRHPNVALLLDQGITSVGEVYLVTELVEGKSLRQILSSYGQGLPWIFSAEIASQIAAGLEAIHGQGLIHRDLKPENLMVSDSPTEERPRVTILDLGHALVLDQTRLTESGLVWGSVPYMSPEQAAGHPLDLRSDLYALGVILYEMLLGRRPFESKAALDVMQMHWSHRPSPPLQRGDISAPMSDLCMWLLAKSPELRPTSARIVQAALEGILSSVRSGVHPANYQPLALS